MSAGFGPLGPRAALVRPPADQDAYGGPDVAGLPAPISDAAEARITRQMQGLARMIDDLIRENAELRREVATLKTQMLTQADLARFATGLKASMEAA